MATSSIFKNVSIREKQLAKSVLRTLERSQKKTYEEHKLSKPCKDVEGDEIKNVLKDFEE